MDIVEFLRARLDEDEAVAREAQEMRRQAYGVDEGEWSPPLKAWDDHPSGVVIAEPARVLREVEAKRRIVDRAEEAGREFDRQCAAGIHSAAAREATAAWVPIQNAVADLASAYADHPDYDPEWTD